jgi:PadR family transcriptional regulator PadR
MTKQRADLLQGTLDMLILKALSAGPLHGYGVGQHIEQMAEDMLRVGRASTR